MKTILAWLDWSSNCSGYNYTFPKTLCSLFWKSFFNIILLPITYITHLWNIFQSKIDFKNEFNGSSKLNMWIGIALHILIGVSGIASVFITENELKLDWFHMADPFLLVYIKIIGGGLVILIMFISIIGISIGLYYLVKYLCKKFINNKREYNEINIAEPSLFKKTYLAIKDKYCPIIDWSYIKKINL